MSTTAGVIAQRKSRYLSRIGYIRLTANPAVAANVPTLIPWSTVVFNTGFTFTPPSTTVTVPAGSTVALISLHLYSPLTSNNAHRISIRRNGAIVLGRYLNGNIRVGLYMRATLAVAPGDNLTFEYTPLPATTLDASGTFLSVECF